MSNLQPGMHPNIREDRYHADNLLAQPTLSHGLACVMLQHSPYQAWYEHPRLNPNWSAPQMDSAEQSKKDFGTAVHCLLLEPSRSDRIVVVPADNWRGKEAQEIRATCNANGKIALLAEKYETALKMVDAAKTQLAQAEWHPRGSEDAELTYLWGEDGVFCRARADLADREQHILVNYKTTSGIANPLLLQRQIAAMGWDVDAAFYCRGYQRITGQEPRYLFVVQESAPPYLLSIIALKPDFMRLGSDKVDMALSLWRDGIENNNWPAYPNRIAWVDAPSYEHTRFEEQQVAMIDWSSYGGGIQG